MLTSSARERRFSIHGVTSKAGTRRSHRAQALDGLRLGVLDNSKWNANKLLRGTSAALGKRIQFACVNY
jgi:hypothetical protein